MLNYTSLFADLEGLFGSAGRDPGSFRRLEREVERVGDLLDEYCNEVAADYVVRLQQRLTQPNSRLTAEEINLLRAWLGLAPPDPQRDQQLVEDLAQLEEHVSRVLQLKDQPLSLKHLDDLRRLLDRMRAVLPRITQVLLERDEVQQFERAVGTGPQAGADLDREWLQRRIRQALDGSDAAPMQSEETLSPFGG